MQPLHPDLRAALKRVHPNLTDETIDRVEELVARRFQLDPSRDAERIAELDRESEALIAREMPYFQKITRAWFSERARPQKQIPPKITIKSPRSN